MKNNINSVTNSLYSVRRESMRLADQINTLDHTDVSMKTYISRVKKLSMQSLDVLNEISRQLSFLTNESKSYEIREQRRKNIEQKNTEYKNRRRTHELYSQSR